MVDAGKHRVGRFEPKWGYEPKKVRWQWMDGWGDRKIGEKRDHPTAPRSGPPSTRQPGGGGVGWGWDLPVDGETAAFADGVAAGDVHEVLVPRRRVERPHRLLRLPCAPGAVRDGDSTGDPRRGGVTGEAPSWFPEEWL